MRFPAGAACVCRARTEMAGPGHRAAGKPLLMKIVMAGEACVGKTSIVRGYVEPGPPGRAACYISTVGIDFKVKNITCNDTTVKLQIWDTAGQEQFHTLCTSYFRGAHGFVLVYDITNSDSFQGITNWIKDIHEKADDEVDIILLGNKCDKEVERVIPKHRGEKNSSALCDLDVVDLNESKKKKMWC
uniref:small monomeric GTPase n=1 Tax=Pelusios castaneus TaxID=367368 RepID=A0A8C8RM23_9SAUR